jgi:hypothetical protein
MNQPRNVGKHIVPVTMILIFAVLVIYAAVVNWIAVDAYQWHYSSNKIVKAWQYIATALWWFSAYMSPAWVVFGIVLVIRRYYPKTLD